MSGAPLDPAAPGPAPPDPRQSRILLCGVAKFDHDHLDDLPAVVNNLADLRQLFTEPDRWEVPDEHCVEKLNPVRGDDVLEAVETAAKEAREALLVYYAGHGVMDDKGTELYLALPGTDLSRPMDRSAVEWRRIFRYVMGSSARRKTVILDCCYSGRALDLLGAEAGRGPSGEPGTEGTCVLTATSATTKTFSSPDWSHTGFTGELVALLRDGLPYGGELLTMADLYRGLDRRMTERGRQEPGRMWPRPRIGLLDHGADIGLVRNPVHRTFFERRANRLTAELDELRAKSGMYAAQDAAGRPGSAGRSSWWEERSGGSR